MAHTTTGNYAVLVLMLGVCAACSFPTIRDLRLADLSIESFDDIPGHLPVATKRPGVATIRTRFTTKTDLGRAAFERDYFLQARFFACDNKDETFDGWTAGVFYGSVLLDQEEASRRKYRQLVSQLKPATPLVYSVYLFPERRDKRSIEYPGNALPDYDLTQSPRDVCMRLQGRAMFGIPPGFHSNVVKIPKEMLQRVLESQ